MGRQPTSKLHASGHRFLTRRLEIALLGGDVDAPHDPVRSQSMALAVGALLSTVVVAIALVLAFLRPQPTLGEAPIALDRESGALYVRVGDTLHPVLNLASARLIAGSSAAPVAVTTEALTALPRGALLGIPGAPFAIAPQLTVDESAWTVCDNTSGAVEPPTHTAVLVGSTPPDDAAALTGERTMLVTTGPAAPTYLIYDGHRAAVDLGDPAVLRALNTEGVAPRLVSTGFVNVIPELPPIVRPVVPAGTASLAGFVSGSVVRSSASSDAEHYVVLPDGLQRIGQVAAELLRSSDSRQDTQVVSVAPDVIARLPSVETLSVTSYPDVSRPVGADAAAVLCARWAPAAGVEVWIAQEQTQPTVELAQADGHGPAVDAVGIPSGRTAFVDAESTTAAQQLFVVTETGVSFAVPDENDARSLGLTGPGVPVPASVLGLLPRGPRLSQADALVARDVVSSDDGVPIAQK